MNPTSIFVYLLAVFGLVRVWRDSYLPYLSADGPDQPPFIRVVRRVVIWLKPDPEPEKRKPWSCSLCMAYLIGVALLPFVAWAYALAPFAAIAVTFLGQEMVRYYRLDPGKDDE